jgi:hypothetical protein
LDNNPHLLVEDLAMQVETVLAQEMAVVAEQGPLVRMELLVLVVSGCNIQYPVQQLTMQAAAAPLGIKEILVVLEEEPED